jgi:hypothetical protein
MNNKTGKDLEGSSHDLRAVLSQYFPEGTVERYTEPQSRQPISQQIFKPSTSQIQV